MDMIDHANGTRNSYGDPFGSGGANVALYT
jgi:hypothetical protein